MKLYRVSPEQAEALVADAHAEGVDDKGNPMFSGEIRGRLIRVIVAADAPDTIITV